MTFPSPIIKAIFGAAILLSLAVLFSDQSFAAEKTILSQSSKKITQSSDTSRDYTEKLQLKPGLTITFPIRDGLDTNWDAVGNYFFTANIETASNDGFSFSWKMSEPADASGIREVIKRDQENAFKVSLFYPKRQSSTLIGYTNAIRISDALFAALKNKARSEFALDGPASDPAAQKLGRTLPRSIQATGQEWLEVTVNNQVVPVRAIKTEADNGWQYWILDNPNFPIMLKGRGPFYWDPPSFSYAVADANSIVNDLEKKGKATTYAIYFAFNSDVLADNSKSVLNGLADFLRRKSNLNLIVEGHTDNVGSDSYNLALSQRRADAVKRYLVDVGHIESRRLSTIGYGFKQPIAENSTEDGRALNRRVVFKVNGEGQSH